MFHDTNKQLFSSVKRLVVIYALVFIQVILILSIPYLIYVSFGMAPIARAAGQPTLSFYDSICIQSFVLFNPYVEIYYILRSNPDFCPVLLLYKGQTA